MDDADIAPDLPAAPMAPRRLPRRGLARQQAPQTGDYRIFIVLASLSGLWHGIIRERPPTCAPGDGALVVGMVVSRWQLRPTTFDFQGGDGGCRVMFDHLLRATKARSVRGILHYPVVAAVQLAEFAPTTSTAVGLVLRGLERVKVLPRDECGGQRQSSDDLLACDLVRRWRAEFGCPSPVLVWLTPPLACRVVSGVCLSVHMLLCTSRMCRKMLLIRREPSGRQLKAMCSDRPPTPATAPRSLRPRVKSKRQTCTVMHDPELILDWLSATTVVREVRKVHSAATIFGKIFARRCNISLHDLVGDRPRVGYETLRQARVRGDVVSMLFHRRFWRHISSTAQVFLYADASPQWRGLELFAATMEIWDQGGRVGKWLMPVISLERTHLDAQGKMLSLLWMVWLLTGPRWDDVLRFTEQVRGVITDQGTERLLTHLPDALPAFWRRLNPRTGQVFGDRTHTFPRALEVPGWCHLWDTVLRRGLRSLDWFPRWFEQMRALISFLRGATVIAQMCKTLEAAGCGAVASMMQSLKLPSIAVWRWRTLGEACASLSPALDSLIQTFNPAPYQNTRDQARLKLVKGAMTEPFWREGFQFVTWYTKWIGGIMGWIAGCDCHDHDDPLRPTCMMRSRRLKSAHGFVCQALDDGLREANGWTRDRFQVPLDVFLSMQGCARATVHVAHMKVEYLNRLPYILVRLDLPGIRRQCLQQWQSAAPAAHHRISRFFLEEGTDMRAAVDAIDDQGGNCAPMLRHEIRSLELTPMDDSIAEGPHALAKTIKDRSKASSFSWIAATMRVQQNVVDIENLRLALECDLSLTWASYKSILQVEERIMDRNIKMTRLRFLQHIYHMSHLTAKSDGLVSAPMLAIEDIGPDMFPPAGGGAAQPVAVVDGNGGARSGRNALNPRATDRFVILMREYMLAALEPMTYISVPMLSEEPDTDFEVMFFQVLSLEPKVIAPVTFEEDEDPEEPNVVLLQMAVQRLERHMPMSRHPNETGDRVDVFLFAENPATVDLLRMCGCSPHNRHMFKVWTPCDSDVAGCIGLTSPEELRPQLQLCDKNVPCLMLLDKLHEQGFAPEDGLVRHAPGCENTYDQRRVWAKRSYLKCLLCMEGLFEAGVAQFASNKSATFYEYMLRFKEVPPSDMSAKEMKAAIADGASTADAPFPELADAPAPFAAQNQPAPLADMDIAGDEPLLALESPEPPQDEDEAESAPEQPVQDVVFGDEGAGEQVWPEFLEGARVRVVRGKHDSGWSYNERLSVRCTNGDHHKCTKSRSVVLQQAEYGPRAPLIFLGAWLRASHMPEELHRSYVPTAAEMRDVASSF